ncbi:MAG: MgtC/SapB family protein [Candidatus Helarchaeota archaeon]
MFRLVLSTTIAWYIGNERKKRDKDGGGSRTLSVVALASCLIAIVTLEILNKINPTTLNFSRMMSYCLVGIGFLCSAVITKSKEGIDGLTTASMIFAIVPISFTIGLGFYFYGIISAIILYIILESKYWFYK